MQKQFEMFEVRIVAMSIYLVVELPKVLGQLLILYNQFVDGTEASGTRWSRSDRFFPQGVEVFLTPRNRTTGLVLNPFSPIWILACKNVKPMKS